MPFFKNPVTIEAGQLVWSETGDEDDPAARLLTHIRICGVDMHLEAWAVEDDDHGNQCALESTMRSDDLAKLQYMMDCAFATATINGRDYVLIATPFGS